MEKIDIFIDTGILRNKEIDNFAKIEFSKQYMDLIMFLEESDLSNNTQICITEIVLEEFKKQICDAYYKEKEIYEKKVCQFKDLYRLNNENEEVDYKNKLEKRIKEYIKTEKIHIAKIPRKEHTFNLIIQKAINKEKPFLGIEKESDKGFKDAIQWESMIEYAKRAQCKRYIFLTKNKNDFVKDLEKEFRQATGKEIIICYEISEVQKEIANINGIKTKIDIVEALISSKMESGELMDVMNKKLNEEWLYPNGNIINLLKFDNLVCEGNNFYSFNVIGENQLDKENIKNTNLYLLNAKLDASNTLNIDEVMICSEEEEQ